jgi:hypothetical protein
MKNYIIISIIILFIILLLIQYYSTKIENYGDLSGNFIQGHDICGNIITIPYDPSTNIQGYDILSPFSSTMTDISSNKNVSYNLDLNTQYHDTLEDIQTQEGIYNTKFNLINAIDICNNNIQLPYAPSQPTVVYNKPGSFFFGTSKYIPNYYDSVLLSNGRQ